MSILGDDLEDTEWKVREAQTAQDEKPGGSCPSQYAIPDGATELQDLIEHREMNFAVGNMFKACYRLGLKNEAAYELRKIIWFARRELARIGESE